MSETIAVEQQNDFATQTLVRGQVLEYMPQSERLFQKQILDDKLLPNTYIIRWNWLDSVSPPQKEQRIDDERALEQGINITKQGKVDIIRQAKQWHELHKEKILDKYEGKHIAIILNPTKGLRTPFRKAIVGAARDFHKLAERIYKKYGYKTIYMPFIRRGPIYRTIQVPSVLRLNK